MSNNQKRIDQLQLEIQVVVDEYNKIQEQINELVKARDALKMKGFGLEQRIDELKNIDKEAFTDTEVVN